MRHKSNKGNQLDYLIDSPCMDTSVGSRLESCSNRNDIAATFRSGYHTYCLLGLSIHHADSVIQGIKAQMCQLCSTHSLRFEDHLEGATWSREGPARFAHRHLMLDRDKADSGKDCAASRKEMPWYGCWCIAYDIEWSKVELGIEGYGLNDEFWLTQEVCEPSSSLGYLST